MYWHCLEINIRFTDSLFKYHVDSNKLRVFLLVEKNGKESNVRKF